MDPEEQIRDAGKPPETIEAWGKPFKLIKETRWCILYKNNELILNISKIAVGILDPSLLANSPSELPCDEKADAAVSLYGYGDGSDYLTFKIPKVWIEFAEDFCNGQAPSVG
jgi:hypothetical protein